MKHPRNRSAKSLAVASLLAACALGSPVHSPALADGISVNIDGQPASFNPPPIERAGRVFVPLRAIFESLGASVVYEGGAINATRGRRSVSLHIGSTDAVVAGSPTVLDSAPFIIGASTYVPLRFVGEALGARVEYDDSRSLVSVVTDHHDDRNGRNDGPPPQQQPPPAPISSLHLRETQPGDQAVVSAQRPLISARFDQNVDPNSVRVHLDGLDITLQTTRSPNGFIFAPPSPLEATQHMVRVTGTDASGAPFERTWRFTSGHEISRNFIRVFDPKPDALVDGPQFTVEGKTLPNAHVHISAGAVDNVAGVFVFDVGHYVGDTDADADGHFSQTVILKAPRGSKIGLLVVSSEPHSHESAEAHLTLHVQ